MEVDFNLNELSQFFLEHSGQEMATLVSEEEPSVADFEEEDVEGNDNTPDCIEEGSCWWDWTIGNRDASLAATSYRGSDEEDEDHLLLLRNASSPYHQQEQEQQLRRDADQDGRSAASCLTRGTKKLLRTLCSLIVYSAPFRFFFKLVFWLINIASGGAHLSGTVSGLSKLFPSLGSPTATNLKLHHIAIPFQISDAVGHIAVSILGSNEMIDGIARSVSSSSCCSSRRSSSSSSSPSKCSQCRMDFWTCCLSCRHELCPCCENGDISSVHHYESPQRHLATPASQRLRTLPSHDHNASSQARSDDEPSFLLSFQQPAASSAADSRGSSTRTNGNIRRPRKVASFWNEDETPSVAARVGLFLLTLFLVFCAEVSSTYRNWQNNAALPISSRIFWVAFYLASHVPEVLYSTMLMVRDYFYGFRLSRQQENMLKDHLVAQIALFRVQQRHPHQAFQDLEPEVIDPDLFSASSSSSSAAASCASFAPFSFEAMHKHKKDFDVEEADEEQDHLDQLLQKRRKTDRLARWISRIFGFLFVLPTYVVKTMSAVGGFRLITGHNEWASWVLGVSGMLAEAYLEYAFTQELFGELIVIIAYRVQGFKRRETGYLFYALTPITYVCILSLSLLVGFLTIPGSYNSAYGVLPDTWDHWKLAICWLYAARYILQAATGLKLLLQNIVSTLRAHYSPPFARLLRAIKDHRSLFLYQFKHLLSPDPAAACQKRCLPFAPQTPSSVLRSPSLIN